MRIMPTTMAAATIMPTNMMFDDDGDAEHVTWCRCRWEYACTHRRMISVNETIDKCKLRIVASSGVLGIARGGFFYVILSFTG